MRRTYFVSLTLGLAMIVVLLMSFGWEAVAQDDGGTPTPDDAPNRNDPTVFYGEPATNEGDAEWTVAANTFTSNYPNGMTFTIQASSDKGEITSATAIWSHAPRQIRRRPAEEYNPDTETFTAVWLAEESTPPWVMVNYRWRFVDAEGNVYTTEWYMDEEYADNTSQWSRYESEDVIVFVQKGLPEETGQTVLDAMAAQRETYRQAWGDLLSNKPRAILFANRQDFAAWRSGSTNPNVIGETRSDWGGMVQVVSGGGIVDLAYGTVLHEVGHLYQEEFAGAGFAAGSWWTEGSATLFELNQQYDYEMRVRNLAAQDELPALLSGTGPNPTGRGPDGIGRYGYDVGYTFWKWMVDTYGLDMHRQVIEGVATGLQRNEVLERELGMSIGEIEREWRLWLGASGEAPTLIPTPEFRFPPTVTPFQFGGDD